MGISWLYNLYQNKILLKLVKINFTYLSFQLQFFIIILPRDRYESDRINIMQSFFINLKITFRQILDIFGKLKNETFLRTSS